MYFGDFFNFFFFFDNFLKIGCVTIIFLITEWRHGRGGHLTLQDEDLTTKTVNGWKKINTLAHYGVKESAVMSLISRQNEFNVNCKQPCHNCKYFTSPFFINKRKYIKSVIKNYEKIYYKM